MSEQQAVIKDGASASNANGAMMIAAGLVPMVTIVLVCLVIIAWERLRMRWIERQAREEKTQEMAMRELFSVAQERQDRERAARGL